MKLTYLIIALMCIGIVSAADYNLAYPKIVGYEKNMDLGGSYIVQINVKMLESGEARCEVGLYTEDDVRLWNNGLLPKALFSIIPIGVNRVDNCVANEGNVDTKAFYLAKNEEQMGQFQIKVPKTYDPDRKYVVLANCYNHCYWESPDSYKGYADSASVNLVDDIGEYEPLNHCSDNTYNPGTESDRDCGRECPDCDTGYKCSDDSDCKSNLCYGGKCVDEAPIVNKDNNLMVYGIALIVIILIIGVALMFNK